MNACALFSHTKDYEYILSFWRTGAEEACSEVIQINLAEI